MTNNKSIAVVGKVVNGRMTVIAVQGGKVAGYSRPVHKAVAPVEVAPVIEAPVVEAVQDVATQVTRAIDVPDFMKEWSKARKEDARRKRMFKI